MVKVHNPVMQNAESIDEGKSHRPQSFGKEVIGLRIHQSKDLEFEGLRAPRTSLEEYRVYR